MGETFPGPLPSVRPPNERLDSWKEIAAYLNRDVTTVQRWEKREGMPVHRHLHDRMGSVYAFRTELDAWSVGRNLRSGQENESKTLAPDQTVPTGTSSRFNRGKRVLALGFVGVALSIGVILWLQRSEYFWRSPITNARFQTITDFGGVGEAATLSRDGHFIAFYSDRDGQMDVWVTQLGSGQFHNLTRAGAPELINPSVRTLGFSPDGSMVTFWARKQGSSNGTDIGIWAVPTLGGHARPYLEDVAEFDWSHDGTRLAYHTPGPGDPLFVSDGNRRPEDRPIFTAPAGLHSHFPLWAPDSRYIYFVQGALPDKLDIWRIAPTGGTPERITWQNSQVSYPVFLDQRTLMYLATDPDGSGPWLYSLNVDRRIPHRLNTGLDRYTSLSASTDGRHLVGTFTSPERTLWRLRIDDPSSTRASASPILLTTSTGFSPRLGRNFLLYVSTTGNGESIWKVSDGASTELWRGGDGARVLGGPQSHVMEKILRSRSDNRPGRTCTSCILTVQVSEA